MFNFVSGSKGIVCFLFLKAFFVLLHEMVGFEDEVLFQNLKIARKEEIGYQNNDNRQ